jgi:hypothetical protein
VAVVSANSSRISPVGGVGRARDEEPVHVARRGSEQVGEVLLGLPDRGLVEARDGDAVGNEEVAFAARPTLGEVELTAGLQRDGEVVGDLAAVDAVWPGLEGAHGQPELAAQRGWIHRRPAGAPAAAHAGTAGAGAGAGAALARRPIVGAVTPAIGAARNEQRAGAEDHETEPQANGGHETR